MVPVEATGEPIGVKTGGGTLEHVLFKLKVRALPKDLPEVLIADVSHLEIGKAIHIGDMKAPPGVEILGDKHISVLAVAAPVSEAQEAAALEAATAPTGEVEMIKEKKEDGTEVEAKPGENSRQSWRQGRRESGRQGCGQAGRQSRSRGREKAGEKKAGKEEVRRPSPVGEFISHCGVGESRQEYAGTRHNIGFLLVERLADAVAGGMEAGEEIQARAWPGWSRAGQKVILCQPQTFMNASGEAVGALARFYQLPLERLLIVVDDADLPLGQIRLRAGGSSGGHHGLESVEQQLATREYPRLAPGHRAAGGRWPADNGLCPGPLYGRGTGSSGRSAGAGRPSRWNAGGAPESEKQ